MYAAVGRAARERSRSFTPSREVEAVRFVGDVEQRSADDRGDHQNDVDLHGKRRPEFSYRGEGIGTHRDLRVTSRSGGARRTRNCLAPRPQSAMDAMRAPIEVIYPLISQGRSGGPHDMLQSTIPDPTRDRSAAQQA